MTHELLVFLVGNGHFGIPSIQVREVLRAATLAPVADAPRAVMGVLNLRGEIVPVLDSRRLLQAEEKPLAHSDHLIVIEEHGRLLALRVDRAVDLVAVDATELPAGGTNTVDNPGSQFAQAFAQTSIGMVQLVDLTRCTHDLADAPVMMDLAPNRSEARP